MKTTKLFRYLWRINSILIFFAALLVVGVLGFVAIEFMDFGRHNAEQAVQVDTKPEELVEPPTLGSFHSISGMPLMRAALTFGARYSRSSFSKGGAYSIRNYLFFNSETGEARWLFSTDKQLILDSDELRETIQKEGSKSSKLRAIAFSYQIIDTDTDGDKQLTPADTMTLAYSRPDGSEYTRVLNGVGRIRGTNTIERGTKHVVVYEVDGKWHTIIISLRTFEVEKQGELPAR